MRDVTTRVGVQDRGSAKLKRASREVSRYGRAWATTAKVTSRAMRLMDRGFGRLRRTMGTLMRRAKFMMIGFQLTATIMGASMVKAAMKYERALRNVTSLMAGVGMSQELIEKNFRSMDMQIRSMAVRTGQMPLDLAEGMYNVVSATFDGASGLNVLEAAAVGAFAGMSDTATTTGLLTKTLQAYREENETNMDVSRKAMATMDDYFMAVNRGMFTFDDLANKMGALPSTAAAFGVGQKDLLAFLSTATVRGVGLDEAITGVRQTLLSIGKLTPQTQKAAETVFGADYEDKWGPAALAANGLYGTMENLNEVLPKVPANIMEAAIAMEDEGGDAAAYLAEQMGANVGAIAELFPNIRALKAVLAVSGPGMKLYGENMEFMADSTGAAGRAQAEMAKSAEGSLQFLKAAWETFKIDVGNIALPFIKNIADSMMGWWGGLPNRFASIQGIERGDFLKKFGIEEGGAMYDDAVAGVWADVSPGDKIAFILKTAWGDAITNLTNWFESGGEGRIQSLGAAVAGMFTGALDAISGTSGDDVKNNIGYRMGKAFIDGFKDAISEWADGGGAESFLSSTFGKVLTVVTAGLIGGPGAAGGAWVGNEVSGGDPVGTGVGMVGGLAGWQLLKTMLPKLLTGGAAAGGAAVGGAGAGGGGGGMLASLWAAISGSTVGTSIGLGALSMAPILAALAPVAAIGALLQFGTRGEPMTPEEIGATRAGVPAPQQQSDNPRLRAVQGRLHVANPIPWEPRNRVAPGTGFNTMIPMNAMSGGRMQELDVSPLETVAGTYQDAADSMESAADPQLRAAVMQNAAALKMSYAATRFANTDFSVTVRGPTVPIDTRTGARNQALGGHGVVNKPTLFLAGEAGPEEFKFTPRRNGGATGGSTSGVTVSVGQINVTEASDARQTAAVIVRELEKAVSNG